MHEMSYDPLVVYSFFCKLKYLECNRKKNTKKKKKGRAWYAILGTKSQVHHEPPGIIRQLCKLHVYSSTYPKINSRRASQYFYPSLLVSLYHISESHHVKEYQFSISCVNAEIRF